MVVNVNAVLKSMDDTELLDEKGSRVTLRTIAIESLLAAYKGEESMTGDEKMKRWELASKIKHSHENCELAVEEISMVKTLVGKAYGPLVVGQVWYILEHPVAPPTLEVVK
jgi:hypothetical protein